MTLREPLCTRRRGLIRRSQVRILPGAHLFYLQIVQKDVPRRSRWGSFDAMVTPPTDQDSAASRASAATLPMSGMTWA